MTAASRDSVRPALLLGSDFKALAAVRSLARRRIPVAVLDSDPRSAWYSRYVGRRLRWHSGLDDPALAEWLLAQKDLAGAVLLPMQDDAVELISRNHARLAASFVLTTPPWHILVRAHQKALAYEAADCAGVDHPLTWQPSSAADLAHLPIRFPAIVKPTVPLPLVHALHRKALYAADEGQLGALYSLALKHISPSGLLVQEFIPGGGESQFSYCAILERGTVLASMTARRRRQYPIDFGLSSSFVEAVDVPELHEPAQRLLAELRLSGLVEVEFKRHPGTLAFHLLDVNARAWAWHGLCSECGVDFIDLEYRRVNGEPIPEVKPHYGARWRRGLTDLLAGMALMRAGETTLSSYLASLRGGSTPAVFQATDPWPALVDVPIAALRMLGRRRKPLGQQPVISGGVRETPPAS